MQTLPNPLSRRVGEAVKAGCRFVCKPLLPVVPDAVANCLPFLGRVSIPAPGNVRLRFHTYGPYGKDRIAIKLARRGFWSYEGETTRTLLALLESANTFIDIGANTGLFAILAGKLHPTCQVWAFEPVPFIHDMLEKNIQLNQLANVEAVRTAIADFVGTTPFYITHTSGGIPTDSSSCAGFRTDVEEHQLPTTTLDEFMASRAIPRLDVLKIDTEAAESKVIRGALETLRKHRPSIVCEVLENVDHGYLQETLRSLDYRFYHITANKLDRHDQLQGSLCVDQRNYLMVPVEKETTVRDVCERALAAA